MKRPPPSPSSQDEKEDPQNEKKKMKFDDGEILLERLDQLEIMLEGEQENYTQSGELSGTFKVIVKDKLPVIWCLLCDKAAAKITPGMKQKEIKSKGRGKTKRHRESNIHMKRLEKK